MMMQMCQLEEEDDKEEEREMQQCCNMSIPAESMAKRQKEDKEENKAQPNIYTIHAKHVITIPKDVQLTHNTHGETHDELLGLSGDGDLLQMKPSLPLWQAMPPLWMMRLKDKA